MPGLAGTCLCVQAATQHGVAVKRTSKPADALPPQVLLSRMALRLGNALQPPHTAAAAAVLTRASTGVAAQLPELEVAARRNIAAAVLKSSRPSQLIKSALHAIVAGSSR